MKQDVVERQEAIGLQHPGYAPRQNRSPGMPRNERALGSDLRPHPNLLIYYALTSLALGPFFFALLIPIISGIELSVTVSTMKE